MTENSEIVFIALDTIVIADRARQEFNNVTLGGLMTSMCDVGQLQPICLSDVEGVLKLDAGERRMKAARMAYQLGDSLYFNGEELPVGTIACTIDKNPSELTRLKKELAENEHRDPFEWQEEAGLKQLIVQQEQTKLNIERGVDEAEIEHPSKIPMAAITPKAIEKAIEKFKGTADRSSKQAYKAELELAVALQDEEIGAVINKAKTKTEATKLLKKIHRQHEASMLAESVGKTFKAGKHKLLQGDCVEVMKTLPRNEFELCITDPTYGIGADKFGNSGGRASSFSHDYDDSYATWQTLMPKFLEELTQVMKPHSHIYLACDMERFFELKRMIKNLSYNQPPKKAGGLKRIRADGKAWKVQRLPIIQLKNNGRVPIVGFSYRRSYECWLYAGIGQKQTNAIINDTIKTSPPKTTGHGAVKSGGIFQAFYTVSGSPGQKIIDPFMGSGSGLKPAHEASMVYVGIELAAIYYGESLKALKKLKKEQRD